MIYFPIIIFIFVKISHLILLKQTNIFLGMFVKRSALEFYSTFAYFFANFSLVLFIQLLFIKKPALDNFQMSVVKNIFAWN